MKQIKRAIISVSDKTGVVGFAQGLLSLNVEIISTGGTARTLSENGVSTTSISDITKYPEMLDGRVKTLHPAVHGGILARRSHADHMDQLKKQNIRPIDMVVVNLYPFEKTIAGGCVTLDDAIENIDIGGPTMIRSGAKNFQDVVVVVDPSDYHDILKELKENDGRLFLSTRLKLATKTFQHTSKYDNAIYNYLEKIDTTALKDKY